MKSFSAGFLLFAAAASLGGCRRDEPPAGGGTPLLDEADFARQRAALVAQLGRKIDDERVLEAVGRIPRHEFVAPEYRHRSYTDAALPIGEKQTTSPPSLVAYMTSLLELEGDETVLEIGTGSGYQAALLAELAARVYSIEIRPALKNAAEARLGALRRQGVLRKDNLVLLEGDGAKGYPEAAPFDCIIVTAAPSKVPIELLNQLKPGGRLVIPVGSGAQSLQLIRKEADGSLREETTRLVRFAPLEEPE